MMGTMAMRLYIGIYLYNINYSGTVMVVILW